MGFGLRVQSLRAVGLRLKAMSVMVHSTWGATLPPNLSGTGEMGRGNCQTSPLNLKLSTLPNPKVETLSPKLLNLTLSSWALHLRPGISFGFARSFDRVSDASMDLQEPI